MLCKFNDGKKRRGGWPQPSARVHHLTPGVQKLVTAKNMVKKVVEDDERGEARGGRLIYSFRRSNFSCSESSGLVIACR